MFGVAPDVLPTPTLFEGDDALPFGQRVDQGWIPVVEVAAEVLQQDERDIARPEIAVGVLDAVFAADSLGRDVGVPRQDVGGHLSPTSL